MRSSQGWNDAKSDSSRAFTHASYDSPRPARTRPRARVGTRRARFQSRWRDADERGVVGVVREGRGVRLELLEELAEPVVRSRLVDDLLERRELRRARRSAARRHEDGHVPDEHAPCAPEVRELAEAILELRERRFHGRGLYRRVRGRSTRGTLAPWRTSRRRLFDDIYLGLRAGAPLRKQRRGEPLSAEEEEAIGRWQRLSLWRKVHRDRRLRARHVRARLHVGGLIFGRWPSSPEGV